MLDVQETEGEIIHLCDGKIEIGAEVNGQVDYSRRFDLTQQHSADHIISGLIHSRYGYDNVGFHIGADTTTIDLSGELDDEQLQEMELIANSAIWMNIPVEVLYPSPEELAKLSYRSKKELSGQVRLVKIGSLDLCACCGTHVSRTGEVGMIKIISAVKFRGGTRFEYVAGRRAYSYIKNIYLENRETSVLLSAKQDETARAVRRLYREKEDLKLRIAALEKQSFAAKAEELSGKGDALIFEDGLSSDGVRRLCDAVAEKCGGRAAVFSANDSGFSYAVGERGGNLKDFTKLMNTALNGRGGGKPDFIQGQVSAAREQIEQFFKDIPACSEQQK